MNQVFEMHLQETPFKLISNGLKTVETRINNKGREKSLKVISLYFIILITKKELKSL